MLRASAEAIAWMVTLAAALAIAGLVAPVAWCWRQRRSACGLFGRDIGEVLARIDVLRSLRRISARVPRCGSPVAKRGCFPNDEALRSAIGSEAGYSTWAVFLMRATFSTLSTIFGSLGIFLFYLSWFTQADFSAYGLILLGSATCIVFSLQHGAWIRRR